MSKKNNSQRRAQIHATELARKTTSWCLRCAPPLIRACTARSARCAQCAAPVACRFRKMIAQTLYSEVLKTSYAHPKACSYHETN
eukprot:2681417-Pyramimonas_sp.AAC.3